MSAFDLPEGPLPAKHHELCLQLTSWCHISISEDTLPSRRHRVLLHLQVEKLVPCQLSAYQKALCQLAEGEVQTEEACKESQALRRLNNTLMELRTICNHPLIRYMLLVASPAAAQGVCQCCNAGL